jgi:hypothetical protein
MPSRDRSASQHTPFGHLEKFQWYSIEYSSPRHAESFHAEIYHVLVSIRRAIHRLGMWLAFELLETVTQQPKNSHYSLSYCWVNAYS